MGEPFIQQSDWGLATVPTLMVVDLARKTFFLGCLVDAEGVLGHHVPVVESVGHEHGSLHAIELVDVVSTLPKFIIVAGGAIELLEHPFITYVAVAVLARRFVSGIDEVINHIDILSHVSTRMAYEPIGAVVVVVRSVRSDRHDAFQAIDTGGGCR